MDSSRRETLYRTGISIFVTGLLAAQASTLLITARASTVLRSKLYPFIEYPMYGIAHYEGERVTATWVLEGVYASGRTIEITREMLDLSIWDYNRVVQGALAGYPGAVDGFRELIRERVPAGSDLQQVRINSYAIKVTRHGPQDEPSKLAMSVAMTPAS
jgi:hypothetical protein